MGKAAVGVAIRSGAEETKIRVRPSEHIVLECDCGDELVLVGPATGWRTGNVLECECGEEFTLSIRKTVNTNEPREIRSLKEDKRRYSWLEDCLERLEGKEARQEYYARLEKAALS